MNSTESSGGFLGSGNISGFGYGVGLSVGILLLILTITLASYCCTRTQSTHHHGSATQRTITREPPHPHHVALEMGLDEETLVSYPKMLYSEVKITNKDSTATCCSICLGDYRGRDMLRLLPDCGHLFHLKCVDPWLRLNATCPVCRTSPLPSPLSTPLAEVVPLATRRDIG